MKRLAIRLSGALALAFAAFATSGIVSAADEFPSETFEVITHSGAGGGTDVTTRMMMLRARRELEQDMVVVSKRGGEGAAAMAYFMTRPDDGHTIMAYTIGHATTMAKGKTDVTLDAMRPLARGTDDPQIFMGNCKQTEARTGEELVAAMKTGTLKFGTANAGGIDHISAYVFAETIGGNQPTIVPFSGGGEVATQLVAGAVDVGVLNLSEAISQIEAGDICPLVVLGTSRLGPISETPTAQELGHDVVFSTVRGFVTHASVSDAKAALLEEKLLKAMNHGVYQGYLQSVGLDSSSVIGAAEWGAQLKRLQADMSPALKAMGLK